MLNGDMLRMQCEARKLAMHKRRPYAIVGSGGVQIITTGGDIVTPRMRTGAVVPPQVAQARERAAARAGTPSSKTGGACGCGPNTGCPTPAELASGANIAVLRGRVIPGRDGKCDYAPLSFGGDAIAGGTVSINQNSPVLICPERLCIVTTQVNGFRVTTLKFGNRPQFAEIIANRGLHSAAFAPDAVQAIPFKGDCLDSGAPFQFNATNLDGANPQSLDAWFLGPMQGM